MADSELKFARDSDQDPVGENPFAERDLRRQAWTNATEKAVEFLSDFKLAVFGLTPTTREAFLTLTERFNVGRFDIWAWRGLAVVWTDAAFTHYEDWLCRYAADTLALFKALSFESSDKAELIPRVHFRLMERVEYWKGIARQYL